MAAMVSMPEKISGFTRSLEKNQKRKEFEFSVPHEAPVFEPTKEEFEDPLAYIRKIRPIAELSGICKIKPPPDWQPPFAVDVDKFKFTPRIQRLNELEAKTRIKLNFLDSIAKFWELQGSSLKIPMVERKALDLYTLHRIVQEEGGLEAVTKERKWSKVSARMGFPQGRGLGTLLKHHYDRILYPFDIFRQGKLLPKIKIEEGEAVDGEKKDNDYKPHGITSRQAITPPKEKYSRRSKRIPNLSSHLESPLKAKNGSDPLAKCDGRTDMDRNNELRRLQFYGAGPKMAGYETRRDQKAKVKNKISAKKVLYEFDPLAKYVCHTCNRGDSEESMLLCDGCDDSYHTFCLMPPLGEIPKGDWRCPKCVAEEVSKPIEAFGFEQAQREYTLQQFGEMADQFKSDYFNMPVHMVPLETVEREFWRITSSIDEDVTVEYGADLHTMDHGSGFPTKNAPELFPLDESYAESGWNLNNLPVLEGSVLGHINADISGMKVPWMYVGMCFATFCWHNEDHWSYSINYLHWGEPKTWYGVPGSKAECFETSMKSAAPELFQSQPDLLHQLVTIMNPNILMNEGVPVCRTDQHAGEFVITFPRAYHAGFNQGYNFAEAVNFAPADWLRMGRECVNHYSMLRRFCVFSHDELVCKMAVEPDGLDLTVANATYQDMLEMVDKEKKVRKSLLEWGVTEAEREAFELLPDDERQCEVCKTTCFLSAVTCSCSAERLACLRHFSELCECKPTKHTLRYRYTLDELPEMLQTLKLRAESFDNWVTTVKDAVDVGKKKKLELEEMKALLGEAEDKKFPQSELLQALVITIQEGEKCADVAKQLTCKKVRTRTRQVSETRFKLTVEELTLFTQQIDDLPCIIKETAEVKALLRQVMDFEKQAQALLDEDIASSKSLEECIELGMDLNIELPELQSLKYRVEQAKWLEHVQEILDDHDNLTGEVLQKLLDSGVTLPPHSTLETMRVDIQELITLVEQWEIRAKESLMAKNWQSLDIMGRLREEGESIPAFLPTLPALIEAIRKGTDWSDNVSNLQSGDNYPYIDYLDQLVSSGRLIPIRLENLPLLESHLQAAKTWRDRTARTFLRKNSHYSLMDALSPRVEVGINALKSKKKRQEEAPAPSAPVVCDIVLDGVVDPASVVAAFKGAESREMAAMLKLRKENLEKRTVNAPDAKYCICRRGFTGNMLQCELCKDWFHSSCVPVAKSSPMNKPKPKDKRSNSSNAKESVKFLCPCCMRSRRPRLETILSLLVSLQKLPVRIPEGEALQCLTERAMNWQDRARQLLATAELSTALARLSLQSQRLVEIAAREKTEKIINSELKKAACNPYLHSRMKALSCQSGLSEEGGILGEPDRFSFARSEPEPEPEPEEDEEEEEEETPLEVPVPIPTPSAAFSSSEHAYSSASRAIPPPLPTKKHSRKSPLVPRKLESPTMVLSNQCRIRLETLTMEGDLLEVSLDELNIIWRIIQAAKPRKEQKYPDCELMESDLSFSSSPEKPPKAKEPKKRNPKKRSADEQIEYNADKRMKKLGKLILDRMMRRSRPKPKKKPQDPKSAAIKKIRKTQDKRPYAMKRDDFDRERDDMLFEKEVLERRPRRPAHTMPPRISFTDDESEDEPEVEEDCAAEKCLRPTGVEVDWVQCDGGCQKWFHLHCVGLRKGDINEDDDYFCKHCTGSNTVGGEDRMEIPTEDESVGLDALLCLASGDPLAVTPDEGWRGLPGTSTPTCIGRVVHPNGDVRLVVDIDDSPPPEFFQQCVLFDQGDIQPN